MPERSHDVHQAAGGCRCMVTLSCKVLAVALVEHYERLF